MAKMSPKRAIIDVNSRVSGWNYHILISIIAKLLTSQPLGDLSQKFIIIDCSVA